MSISWLKKGLIYCPNGSGFFKTHAARPIPFLLNEGTLRIFYSSRDSDDRMLPTFVDVDVDDPSRILHLNETPLVELGPPGAFDDSGVTLGSIAEVGGRTLLYYTGWKRRRVVSFELSIGVIEWDRGRDRYSKVFEGPIMAQDIHHPLLVAGPYVRFDNGKLKMWYCSGTDWKFPDGNPEPIYTVFSAESTDGVTWKQTAGPLIKYDYDGEVISAPWVIRVRDQHYMWYSKRGCKTRDEKNYTIGVATSNDGCAWQRRDDLTGISKSESGWDSEMICYPSFFPHQEKIYMFYSGNGVGRGGMGYAETDGFSR